MTEYRFDYNPVVPPGRVVFRVQNAGRVGHRLAVLPLADDLPPIDAQPRGSERQVIAPFAGVPPRRPGSTGTFAVELAPGRRYAMICSLVDPEGKSHALKGMNSEFRTAGTPAKEAAR